MKASDLKPGQWFEFEGDEHKRRCRRTADGYEFIAEDNLVGSEEVTPLNVTGWDEPHSEQPTQLAQIARYLEAEKQRWEDKNADRYWQTVRISTFIENLAVASVEPAPLPCNCVSPQGFTFTLQSSGPDGCTLKPTPAPLQLREGVEYVSRDGSYRTKVVPFNGGPFYRWAGVGECRYKFSDNGKIFNKGECDSHDLIAEVPPPLPHWTNTPDAFGNPLLSDEVPQKEQFKAGDWVVCVEGDCDVVTGTVYQVASIDSDDLIYVGVKRDGYFRYRFRRATPAEVAAHKQANAQPDADQPIINWVEVVTL